MVSDPSYCAVFGHKIHRAWLILAGCCFLSAGSLGAILGSNGVFAVSVCEDLGFLRSEYSLWITVYFLSMIPAMPLAGHMITRFNSKAVMGVSALACAIAAALMGTYTQLWQFIVSGLVFGVFGTCVFQMPAAAMLGNWFDRRAGFALGLASAFASLCTAFFSPLFQFFIESFGWRATYGIQGLIVAGMTLPWIILVLRLRPSEIGALPYGYGEAKGAPAPGGSKAAGVPYKKALLSVSFVMVFLFAGIGAMIGSGFDAHLPGFAVSIGYDAAFGALLVSALQIGSVCEKMLMGLLNDKIGAQRTVHLEFIAVIGGILILLFAQNEAMLLLGAFLFGTQDSFSSVSLPLLVKKHFGRRNYEKIYSWARVGSGTFGSFAVVLVGLSYDLTSSFKPAFFAAILMCAIGSIVVTIAGSFSKRLSWEEEGGKDSLTDNRSSAKHCSEA